MTMRYAQLVHFAVDTDTESRIFGRVHFCKYAYNAEKVGRNTTYELIGRTVESSNRITLTIFETQPW